MRSKMKWGDYVIAGTVLLLAGVMMAALALWHTGDKLVAEIWQDDVLVERVILTEQTEQIIELDGHNTILLRGRTARMLSADCRDQVCVRTGTLYRAGQAAVCLPHRVVLKLVGSKSGIDAIAS